MEDRKEEVVVDSVACTTDWMDSPVKWILSNHKMMRAMPEPWFQRYVGIRINIKYHKMCYLIFR